jgi:hypothetical protein
MTNSNTVFVFPILGNFPNILKIGTSSKTPNYSDSRKVLVIMDVTGSMGEYINEKGEGSKYYITKEILIKLRDLGNDIDVLPFNTEPYDICTIDNIPPPDNSTYFSPLVPEVERILKESPNKYKGAVLISDGLPTENKKIAHSAIKTLGNLTREYGMNPVSLAVGCDADGSACALFSGNRGFECFIKYKSTMEAVVKDIHKGIHCSYEMIPNGDFIPVENDGKFYYLSKEEDKKELTNNYSMEIIMKYINLVILQELSKDSPNYNELRKFIKVITDLINDKSSSQMMYNHFDEMIGNVYYENSKNDMDKTPGAISHRKQQFRTASQQV